MLVQLGLFLCLTCDHEKSYSSEGIGSRMIGTLRRLGTFTAKAEPAKFDPSD